MTGATARWRAAREWVAPGEEGGLLSLDRLVGALGGADVRVPVVECGGRGGKYGEEPRREMSLGACVLSSTAT